MKQRDSRVTRTLLIVGFLAVAVGILVAHASPAHRYEVSLYQSTPIIFWAGVGLAVLASLVVVVFAPNSRAAIGGLALAGLGITSVSALPLVRQYYFYGFNDSLTHLGWTKSIAAETISPFEIVYPSGHISAGMFSSTLGLDIATSMMLVVFFLSLVYLVFVPLIVSMIVPDRKAVLIAVFSGLLFLPVNLNGFKLMFFPYSLASFLGVVLLYLFFKHQFSVTDEMESRWRRHVTPVSILFTVGTIAVVAYHLQAALNFLVLFVVAAVIQFVQRQRKAPGVSNQRPVYGLTFVFAVVSVYWFTQYSVGASTSGLFIDGVLGLFSGDSAAGTAIAQRTGSVSAVGGGILDVFVKLFLVNAVYALVTFAVFVGLLFGRFDDLLPRGRSILLTLTFSLVVLVPYFFAHLLGDLSGTNFFFRHVGFSMILATIVGSVGLYYAFERLAASRFSTAFKTGAPIAAALVIGLSLMVMFPSPYIYLPSNHVPAQQMQAYDTAFEMSDEDVRFVGIRGNPDRFAEALPNSPTPELGFTTPDEALSDLPRYYDGPRYLMVSKTDYDREVTAYRELRYSDQNLTAVRNQPNVNRVMSNGASDLYYVAG
ncbi:hypothetical protein E6P09_16780 (plasmid) [Haloferax mediterranei ATCC 33500]|uniref:DUF2206 domain-containing protein n=1 Tax=Haloferax mediterranei (strain ATCC 33500 / DSM 1411 / JCM 8866 / NBRC 14739 / NCIMB 2177 / R-4) TaxID=523841 RepID=I3RAT2_HALMT|nr:hypothetical protein [Haloferax mediterranei]AFK21342.1 hypothetical protein HFX_6219 [Haloferax mediterranei ATCC 33500]AHZ24574.1 hypothetical protein BM92_16865 [Haloferax mediterranei ATCC 33500]ELZ97331.1 hypothetical protein C439_18453 [Haloferax mediterranei ATCC 33500]MDX5990372.1 hypothetical protein [Haloferax mediterranei ATCC 33500]QCQ76968.1 hypothetical protein E6P09_16780 [Haloferax mediterranei ATCC 33500]